MMFSERYKELIDIEHGECKDNICGDIKYRIKEKIANVIIHFHEPITLEIDRYSHETKHTNVVLYAIAILTNKIGYPVIPENGYAFIEDESTYNIAGAFTPYIFDLIEIMYDILSDEEKIHFSKALNDTLHTYDVPWVLVDGRMIKIDSIQFEQDLKRKTLAQLNELKDSAPIFQSAYDELIKAKEFLDKGDYQESIINSAKSYESIMKIILSASKGNADRLTKDMISEHNITLPDTINEEGFRSTVMMSLPQIRNQCSGHGAGANDNNVSLSLANLSFNLACTLDTYLIEEYKNRESKEV